MSGQGTGEAMLIILTGEKALIKGGLYIAEISVLAEYDNNRSDSDVNITPYLGFEVGKEEDKYNRFPPIHVKANTYNRDLLFTRTFIIEATENIAELRIFENSKRMTWLSAKATFIRVK